MRHSEIACVCLFKKNTEYVSHTELTQTHSAWKIFAWLPSSRFKKCKTKLILKWIVFQIPLPQSLLDNIQVLL